MTASTPLPYKRGWRPAPVLDDFGSEVLRDDNGAAMRLLRPLLHTSWIDIHITLASSKSPPSPRSRAVFTGPKLRHSFEANIVT
jgi:hypothetical protein